jgi:eukaryotic-like serine/threonine-protein kinase
MANAPRDRWPDVERVLDAALDLAPERRAAYVANACAGDAALRADVERMLRSCDAAPEFLEGPAQGFAAPLLASAERAVDAATAGTRVGPYRLVALAGRGGMGAVWLAERADDQYRRQVALKLVRRGLDGDARVVRRFVEERQILASLDHPHIARLLDGGVTEEGLPYFAMEYVEGTPIDQFCAARRLPVDARLRLFAAVADAVQHAHRQLVVHRDLKPSNILVTADGEPRLLDFGIAKLLARDERAPGPAATGTESRVMTPEYASPEQLRGDAISTASDVYSLGVLLYELLAGRRPHDTGGRPRHEVERAIAEDEPEAPSAALASDPGAAAEAARARGTTPERLRRQLRGDLDTIVLTAMRTDPARRYGTAEQLAADVRRHLAGLPVSARRDTWPYRAQKFVRRHRVGVAAASAFAILLVGASVVTVLQASRVADERDRAEQVSRFLVGLFTAADPYAGAGREVTARTLLDSGAVRVARDLTGRPEVRAHLAATIGRAYYGLGQYAEARRLLERALALRGGVSDDADTSVAQISNLLAQVMLDQGDHAAAELRYRRVLALRRRLLGADDPEVAQTLRGLALALRARGDGRGAEPLLREALTIQRRRGTALDVAATLNVLAHVLRDRGDYAAAEPLYHQVYALRRARLGEDHPDVANSLVNIGGVLASAGHYDRAEPLLRRGIASKRRSLGDDHPDVATDMGALAVLLRTKGDSAAAESMYRDVLARQRRLLPRGHSRTVVTLLGLGDMLLARGRFAAAEPLLREAVTVARAVLPPSHPRVADAQRALGECLLRQGRYAEGEPLLLASLATFEATRGPRDRRAREALQRVVELYERWPRPEAAASYRARVGRP